MEEWRKIAGYDRYYISNLGRIKNKHGHILKQHRWFEYCDVKLQENNVAKHHKVHRLVAEAFVPNPKHKPQVNHIDGITMHNEASNLEWVTDEENKEHRRRLNDE
jgi:hypothetical protein